jgi:predicted AlkP superfamily phosphohydrolase/phosphomutase
VSSLAGLLLLGIDAANPDLLERWGADGALPALGALLERGLVARTRGLQGFFVGSTWPSLVTGVNPARHGVHYLPQLAAGTYSYRRAADGPDVRRDPFWLGLSRSGRRMAILDVPLSCLTPGLNGIQTVEWGGHDAVFGFRAWPDGLAADLEARFGRHPLGPTCDGLRRCAEDYGRLVERLVRGAELKGRLTRHLLAQGRWDLLLQVFTEAHCVGHQCWHLHDPRHPAHDPAVTAAIGDPIRTVYQAIDAAIGEVLRDAGDGTVVVFAAHGMSYAYGAHFLLPEILARLGVAVPLPPATRRPRPAVAALEGVARLWRRLPLQVKQRLALLRDRLRGSVPVSPRLPTIEADPSRSRCFAVRNGLAVGGIRLNLVGREPQGLLQPGAEAGVFSERLAADLLEIVDERTGRSLIRRVIRTADLYQGERLCDLPDLLVEWSDEVPTGSLSVGTGASARVRVRSPKIGVLEGVNDYGRTGEHRPDGILIAAGPRIRPGRVEGPVSLLDLAPSFTAMLGASLPDCDGRPVPALLGDRPHSGFRSPEP